ncbi:MAG: ABC transporter permease subunit [Bacteroidota bacterium]|nr:ABC transporter permease subunit [Bacteroidota bacterium]
MHFSLFKTWVIARRELQSFFNSLMAYVIIITFLGFTGFFTWIYGTDIFLINQASLRSFFDISYWTLFFFIPAITMRMISEDNKTGTIDFLIAKVKTIEIVLGKFLSCIILLSIILAFTLPYYFSVSRLGNIDNASVICGYSGLILMSIMYISIGIFASCITDNQVISLIIALCTGIFFQLFFGLIADNSVGLTGEILYFLSIYSHFDNISKGIIDSGDIIYFFSFSIVFLYMAILVIDRRKSR